MLTLAKLAVALAGIALLGSVAAVPAPQNYNVVVLTHSQDAIVPIVTATETYTNAHGSLTTATITISKFTGGPAKNMVAYPSFTAKNTDIPIPGAPNHHSIRLKPTHSFTLGPSESTSHISAHSDPSSLVHGIPVQTNHAAGDKPSGSVNLPPIASLGIEIAREVQTPAYGLPTGVPTHTGILHHMGGHKPSVSQSNMHPERPTTEVARDINPATYGLPTGAPTHHLTGLSPHGAETPHHKTGKPSMAHHSAPIIKGNIKAMYTVGPEGTNK